jgi:hypothetical protein
VRFGFLFRADRHFRWLTVMLLTDERNRITSSND